MKHFLLTCFFLFGLCFLACDRVDGGGPVANKMIVRSLVANLGTSSVWNSRLFLAEFDSLWQGDTLGTEELFVATRVSEADYVASRKPVLWGKAAYADTIERVLKHAVRNLSVTSEKTLYANEEEFAPGEELSQLFEFGFFSSKGWKPIEPTPQELGGLLEEFGIQMRLSANLQQALDQKMTISISFDDGSTVSVETGRMLAK